MDARIYKGSYAIGSKTASAGTAFTGLIYPKAGAITRLVKIVHSTGSTAHTLSILRAQGAPTTVTVAAAASATTLTVASATLYGTEVLAGSDYIVVEHSDGSYGAYLVTSVAGLVITIPATSAATAVGAKVWGMYEVARALGPFFSIQITTKASTIETFSTESDEVGIASSTQQNEPLLIHNANATAASTLIYASAMYARI